MSLKKDNAGINAAVVEPSSGGQPQEKKDASDPTVGFYVELPKSLRTSLRLEAVQKEMSLRELVIEKLKR